MAKWLFALIAATLSGGCSSPMAPSFADTNIYVRYVRTRPIIHPPAPSGVRLNFGIPLNDPQDRSRIGFVTLIQAEREFIYDYPYNFYVPSNTRIQFWVKDPAVTDDPEMWVGRDIYVNGTRLTDIVVNPSMHGGTDESAYFTVTENGLVR